MDDADPRAADPGDDVASGDTNVECGLTAAPESQPPQPAELSPSQDVATAARNRKYLTDTVAGLSNEDQSKIDKANELGNSIRQIHTASVLEATLASLHGPAIGSAGYQSLRDRVLRNSGAPSDPIEEMLIEQMVLSNYHIGQLHVRAAEAKSAEVAKVFYTALCRMQGESRKLALALQVYRSPPKQSQFTVIRQANLAAGDQQVAFVDQTNNPPKNIPNHDNRLIPSEREAVPRNIEDQAEYCQSAARRGRPRKQPKA